MSKPISEAFDTKDTTEPSLPTFTNQLIVGASPEQFMKQDKDRFQLLEAELTGMRLEISEVPTTESLMKLYTIQSKGRAYYERSEEIYRQYLKYLSTVALLVKKAQFAMDQQVQEATLWMRKNRVDDIKATKSGDERNALITSIIPQSLKEEKFQWETLESQAKTNFTILKSYRDQFKSINDNVLIQLSIFKNLLMVGEMHVDPEIIRAMRVIDSSYKPSQKDISEKREADTPLPDLNIEEGLVNL